MRVLKRNPWLAGLGALLAMMMLTAGVATAETSTDRGGSILAFPKLISDGTRDSLIQISNIRNSTVFAHCMYLDASTEIPDLPPGPGNPRRCVERDFNIRLTRQQPTIWRLSTGRLLNPFDGTVGECEDVASGEGTRQNCPGFDPGNVPLVGPFFEGHLVCVQVDESGAPIGGNALKGEAIIESINEGAPGADGVISAYNAVSIQAIEGSGDEVLELDGEEYSQCPDRLRFTHLGEGVVDPVIDDDLVRVTTELTLMPCTIDYESQARPYVALQYLAWDQMEIFRSTGGALDCWYNESLANIGSGIPFTDRGTVLMTQVRGSDGFQCRGGLPDPNDNVPPAPGYEYSFCNDDDDCLAGGVCRPSPGLLGVAETFRVIDEGGVTGSSAINLHGLGSRIGDTIFLQAGGEGFCADGPNDGLSCTVDADCPAGSCVRN
jgi:hypothetical protein